MVLITPQPEAMHASSGPGAANGAGQVLELEETGTQVSKAKTLAQLGKCANSEEPARNS